MLTVGWDLIELVKTLLLTSGFEGCLVPRLLLLVCGLRGWWARADCTAGAFLIAAPESHAFVRDTCSQKLAADLCRSEHTKHECRNKLQQEPSDIHDQQLHQFISLISTCTKLVLTWPDFWHFPEVSSAPGWGALSWWAGSPGLWCAAGPPPASGSAEWSSASTARSHVWNTSAASSAPKKKNHMRTQNVKEIKKYRTMQNIFLGLLFASPVRDAGLPAHTVYLLRLAVTTVYSRRPSAAPGFHCCWAVMYRRQTVSIKGIVFYVWCMKIQLLSLQMFLSPWWTTGWVGVLYCTLCYWLSAVPPPSHPFFSYFPVSQSEEKKKKKQDIKIIFMWLFSMLMRHGRLVKSWLYWFAIESMYWPAAPESWYSSRSFLAGACGAVCGAAAPVPLLPAADTWSVPALPADSPAESGSRPPAAAAGPSTRPQKHTSVMICQQGKIQYHTHELIN